MIQAAAAAHSAPPPGLFLLVWGLGASAAGLLTVTNYRGFADNNARRMAQSAARRRSRSARWLPPRDWQQPDDPAGRTRQVRLIAIPFAIIGPIVTVVGLVSISHHGIGGSGPGGGLGPFGYVFIGFAVVTVGWQWLSSRGLFRPAGRRGGWRLALAVVASAATLVFGVGMALGQLTIAIAALAFVGVPSVLLMLGETPPGPGSRSGGGPGDLPD
jgi:hypothetical protein